MCFLLTQCGVVEREISQVSRVLRQDEQSPGVAVPHQRTPGTVLQHTVLDDLDTHDMTRSYTPTSRRSHLNSGEPRFRAETKRPSSGTLVCEQALVLLYDDHDT